MIARTSCCQAFKRRVLEQEEQDVALGLLGKRRRLGLFLLPLGLALARFFLEDLRRIDERVHVVLALKLRRLV